MDSDMETGFIWVFTGSVRRILNYGRDLAY